MSTSYQLPSTANVMHNKDKNNA